MLKEYFHIFKKLDSFLKTELLVGAYSLLLPVLTAPLLLKLEGSLFTVKIITIFVIIRNNTDFLTILLKNIKTVRILKYLITLEVVSNLLFLLYFYNPTYFVVGCLIVGIVFKALISAFYTNYDFIVSKRYPSLVKDLGYLEKLVFVVFLNIGGLIAYLLSYYPASYTIYIVFILTMLYNIVSINRYFKFKHLLSEGD